jgi:hypothetical protein
MLILLIPSAVVWAKGRLLWRGSVVEISAGQLQELEESRKQTEVDDLLRDRPFTDSHRIKLMFVGDSHSGDIAAAMFLTLGDEKYDYARLPFAPDCFSSVDRRPWILRMTRTKSLCDSQLEALRKSRSLAETDYLFVADRWSQESIKGFAEGLAQLRGLTKARVIIVGQNAVFPTFDDSLRFLDRSQLARLNRVLYDAKSPEDVLINEELRTLATTNGLDFIDRQSVVCSQATLLCTVLAPDGKFLYTDTNHWSYEGRSVFGKLMVERFGNLLAAGSDQATVARH